MLQNVIDSIIEAEAEAEKIVKDATLEAKEIFQKAKEDSERLLKENADKVKAELKAITDEATKLADDAYAEIVKQGEEQAKQLYDMSQETVKEVGLYIARRLMEKYGNS